MNLKYSEILLRNRELGKSISDQKYETKVLSNIITAQLNELLEYTLRVDDIPAVVTSGDYDNIVQDSLKFHTSDLVIVFWELCNIIDGLQYKINLLEDEQFDAIFEKTKSEIDLVLNNLHQSSLVLFNKPTAIPFSMFDIKGNNLDKLAFKINRYLESEIRENVKLIDLEKIIASIGITKSLDLRYYYSSKALYTVAFFKAYAKYIKPFVLSANGKAKKALIFDCDNTLWKGILGEEGFDGIEMSSKTRDGAIFAEIQSMALGLGKQGILIGLCSKNNPQDVDEVIKSHPDMQLRDEHIAIKKCDWTDKATNLRKIAEELHIGLDSLVFVDDSTFEVNLVKKLLPAIATLQVPERLHNYPGMLYENSSLFYNLSFSKEDMQKITMYKQSVLREKSKTELSDIESYLSSLEFKITVFEDEASLIPRMSQMTQKTNQFNLTTKRYTEGDIKKIISEDNSKIFALSVSDKFGDSGVTGLCIINFEKKNQTSNIDTFLLSCRIIGRNIEYAFMDYIMKYLKKININSVAATYIKTKKNKQVNNFFDKCSFATITSSDEIKKYNQIIKNYKEYQLSYIRI